MAPIAKATAMKITATETDDGRYDNATKPISSQRMPEPTNSSQFRP